jgi:hypothetical protein
MRLQTSNSEAEIEIENLQFILIKDEINKEAKL